MGKVELKRDNMKMWFLSRISIIILCFLLSGCITYEKELSIQKNPIATSDEINIDLIYSRIQLNIWQSEAYNEKTIDEYECDIRETGDHLTYFASIDYNLDESSRFGPHGHLYYMVDMTLQYGAEKIKNDEVVRNKMVKLLDYYLGNDFHSLSNWWWNVIGVPSQLSILGSVYWEYLDEDEKTALLNILEEGLIHYNEDGKLLYTGANLCDEIKIAISYAVLSKDLDVLRDATEVLSSELCIKSKDEEGILEDMSYIQAPGVICMAGSYGLVFVEDISYFISILWGTQYELPESCVNLFVDHLLEGQSFFSRGTQSNYFALERISSYAAGAEKLADAVRKMASLEGIYKQVELQKYYSSFENFEDTESAMKFFDCGYILVRKNEKCNISVKGNHTGIYATHIQNQQGILNYNLSCGGNTCYMSTGDEYKSIASVLDYSFYPGVTTLYEKDEELLNHMEDYGKTWGVKWNPDIPAFEEVEEVDYCSGYVDEDMDVGILYMDLKHEGITGRLMYIIHGNAMYALGCNLECSDSEGKEIITSINQCKAENVFIENSNDRKSITMNDSEKVPVGGWIKNGKFSYCSFDRELTCTTKRMSGSLSRNGVGFDDTVNTENVCQIYISYDNKLSNDSFSYVVVYNDSETVKPANGDYHIVKKIVNTDFMQVIEFNDCTVAVFHTDGKYTTMDGTNISGLRGQIIINQTR